LVDFEKKVLGEIMSRPSVEVEVQGTEGGKATKTSTFGEAEVDDITAW